MSRGAVLGSQVIAKLVQGEATAAASTVTEDVQYEDVPYVLVYATVSCPLLTHLLISDLCCRLHTLKRSLKYGCHPAAHSSGAHLTSSAF